MLHRSASSRRRRASRSLANSAPTSCSISSASRSQRRASVAATAATTEKPIFPNESGSGPPIVESIDRQRSSRSNPLPNIALNAENESPEEGTCRRILPDLDHCNSGRNTLTGDVSRSSRNSLIPEDYYRSPRGSLVPDSGRSPRNSLVPDQIPSRSPRNSLTPDAGHSPRHSLVPEQLASLSPRNSLIPDVSTYNRSPRNSLVPLGASRNSLVPTENERLNVGTNRAPRHSLLPDSSRSPRGSLASLELDRAPPPRSPRGSVAPLEPPDRSPRGSIASECLNQSPRGSIAPDPNRSPRGSIAPDPNRSPRGSICPEGPRSPRGSIAAHDQANRSPRGSIGLGEIDRHSRGSIGERGGNEEESHSPRGSVGLDDQPLDGDHRTGRGGSLTGGQDRRAPSKPMLSHQDPRRASADQGTPRNRSSSPYRQRETNSGSVRSGGSGVPINLGYGTNAWADSRRASSSVSQFSGDESRRLCAGGAKVPEKDVTEAGNLTVATYGSVVFQLKDAHLEANGTCDFVFRALRVVGKTMIVTICLACLSTLPILMFILGLQFIRDCPREPHIPVYMVVGGAVGTVRMFWALYSQIRSRRPEVMTVPTGRSHVSPMNLVSMALSCFLAGWFALGNYWILSIKWPDYAPTLYEPNRWCHKTLYVFSLVHLCIVYAALAASFLVALGLAFYRVLPCSWPERYK